MKKHQQQKPVEFDSKTYDPFDILTIEIENTTNGLVVGNYGEPLNKGITEIEVQAWELPQIIEQVETDTATLNSAQRSWETTFEDAKKELVRKGVKDDQKMKVALHMRFCGASPDNHVKRFYDIARRWPKPLRGVKVLKHRKNMSTMSDAVASHTETLDLLKEVVKQNQELIKSLVQSKKA